VPPRTPMSPSQTLNLQFGGRDETRDDPDSAKAPEVEHPEPPDTPPPFLNTDGCDRFLRTAMLPDPPCAFAEPPDVWAVWPEQEQEQSPFGFRTSMLSLGCVPDEEPAPPSKPRRDGIPVSLHIYDVSRTLGIQKLNNMLANRRSPLKLGGVFHAGVEVNGLEWSFGHSANPLIPGVESNYPRAHPAHHYRQTHELPETCCSADDIVRTISQLKDEYPGHDYEILRRNCCHFADDFCQRLGVGTIPPWVYRLACIGARIDSVLQVAQGRRGGAAYARRGASADLRSKSAASMSRPSSRSMGAEIPAKPP